MLRGNGSIALNSSESQGHVKSLRLFNAGNNSYSTEHSKQLFKPDITSLVVSTSSLAPVVDFRSESTTVVARRTSRIHQLKCLRSIGASERQSVSGSRLFGILESQQQLITVSGFHSDRSVMVSMAPADLSVMGYQNRKS